MADPRPLFYVSAVVMNEIMYDPAGSDSGHEWIEVYNSGTSSVTLTKWKLATGDTNHKIFAVGNSALQPQSYAVIAANTAKFQSDYPAYAGTLFHSSLSLNNGGEAITLFDASHVQSDSVTYDSAWGGEGDGNSLQHAPFSSGQLSPRKPTPGTTMGDAIVAAPDKPASPQRATAHSVKKHRATVVSSTGTSRTSSSGISSSISSDVRASNEAGNRAILMRQPASVAAAEGSRGMSYWWVALAGMLFVTLLAVATARHYKKSEWDIIEESPEDM